MNNAEQSLYYAFVEHLYRTTVIKNDIQNTLSDFECKIMDYIIGKLEK